MDKLNRKQGAIVIEMMEKVISDYTDYAKKVVELNPHLEKLAREERTDLEETRIKILSMIETDQKPASENDMIDLASIAHYPDHMEPDEYWYPNCAVRELQRKSFKTGYEEAMKEMKAFLFPGNKVYTDGWKPFSEWKGEMYCLLYFPDLHNDNRKVSVGEYQKNWMPGVHRIKGVIFAQLNSFGGILPEIGEIYKGAFKPTFFKQITGKP